MADKLQRWMEVADVDGSNLSYADIPETFQDIITILIPKLRRRGVFWEVYVVAGESLKENDSAVRRGSWLAGGYPYLWQAEEIEPEYATRATEREGSNENCVAV